MSSQETSFKLLGANQLRKRLDLANLTLKPLRTYYNATGHVVVKQAKKEAPKDRGKLRAGIEFKSLGTRGRIPAGVKVRSTAPYSSYVHGFMHKSFRQSQPFNRTKPHWPPISAISGWAQRKGINPYLVARAIAKKGTPIIPFLKMGYNNTRQQRRLLLAVAHKDIERQWNKSRKRLTK